LAFDVGTTSIKCAIINLKDFEIISKASTKAVVSYPKKGWAEKDPDVLWESIVNVARAVIEEKDFDVGRIAALIFGAHMAGVLPVDEHGEPLRDVIIWLDERAAGLPKDLWEGLVKIQGYSLTKLLKFLRITGGAPSRTGKDAISKILWIRENEPDIFSKTHKILDVKGFLVHRSTGAYVTSPDEANLSWLADTRGGRAEWSLSILKDYRLSANLFPEIKLSTDVAGKLRSDVAREIGLSDGIPVIVGAGDVCSAAVGSGAVGEGELHIYVGTSNWVAGHISKRRTDVFHYIGSLLSAIPEKYLLIAEQEIAAGALEWAMRLVGIEGKYEDIAEMIESAQPGRLIFMPWLYGERAPIDDPYVRGGLLNVSLEHGRGDVLRALMEGVALNIKWVYSFMEKLTVRQDYVNLVGGGTLFDVWCQIIADAIKRPVRRMKYPEQAGIRGLAAIASVGIGEVESFEVAAAKFPVDKIFKPDTENSAVYDRLFKT
jgi:xylulokinase